MAISRCLDLFAWPMPLPRWGRSQNRNPLFLLMLYLDRIHSEYESTLNLRQSHRTHEAREARPRPRAARGHPRTDTTRHETRLGAGAPAPGKPRSSTSSKHVCDIFPLERCPSHTLPAHSLTARSSTSAPTARRAAQSTSRRPCHDAHARGRSLHRPHESGRNGLRLTRRRPRPCRGSYQRWSTPHSATTRRRRRGCPTPWHGAKPA